MSRSVDENPNVIDLGPYYFVHTAVIHTFYSTFT